MVVCLFLAVFKHRLGTVKLDLDNLGVYQRIIKEAEKIQGV